MAYVVMAYVVMADILMAIASLPGCSQASLATIEPSKLFASLSSRSQAFPVACKPSQPHVCSSFRFRFLFLAANRSDVCEFCFVATEKLVLCGTEKLVLCGTEKLVLCGTEKLVLCGTEKIVLCCRIKKVHDMDAFVLQVIEAPGHLCHKAQRLPTVRTHDSAARWVVRKLGTERPNSLWRNGCALGKSLDSCQAITL